MLRRKVEVLLHDHRAHLFHVDYFAARKELLHQYFALPAIVLEFYPLTLLLGVSLGDIGLPNGWRSMVGTGWVLGDPPES
mmetsp:Transcript_17429/g.12452  ORF Transcript_17429/g.12452 Transcript_17429/m.12452 type:complete len:80 (+) Transcript_17429:38-277(+)